MFLLAAGWLAGLSGGRSDGGGCLCRKRRSGWHSGGRARKRAAVITIAVIAAIAATDLSLVLSLVLVVEKAANWNH